MRRKSALKLLTVGAAGLAVTHPTSRQKIVHTYKAGAIRLFPTQISKKN